MISEWLVRARMFRVCDLALVQEIRRMDASSGCWFVSACGHPQEEKPPNWELTLCFCSDTSPCLLRNVGLGFPGGTLVKNPPANAGDSGSSPGRGRSHMPWSTKARAPQLLSLSCRAHELQLLSPCATATEACVPRARALQQEKPPQ